MNIQQHQAYLNELREYYRNKPKIDSWFSKKFPNAFTPFNDSFLDIIAHLFISLELIGLIGEFYYDYTDGGALLIDIYKFIINDGPTPISDLLVELLA